MTDVSTCVDCGSYFYRAATESWKRRCLSCWLATKATKPAAAPVQPDPVVGELRDNIRGLLSLCHPDRHGNSQLSTNVTRWLLQVRDRLDERVTQ
jgi:hypothetical protein